MKKSFRPMTLMTFLLVGGTAMAQDGPIKVTQLVDQLYLLSTDQGTYTTNTIAFVGNDGVLLVDTQSENEAEELKKAVLAFGKGFPKYIINTHRHVEHIGGNAVFGDSPVVIAHHLVPQKLKSGSYLFNEFPESTFPDITLDDSLTLYFNGDRIQIQALLASHDDTEIVRNGLAEGKDLATLQKENVLEEWESYAGSYVSTDDWIEYLVNGLQKNKETRKTVFEPIYHVWKEKGADVAVEHYFELKRDHPDEYRFPETSLLVIGNKLLGREHIEAAIAFFEASLQEFPESKYNYYLFYKLADAHNRMGNTKLAVVYCEKSLKLKPDFRAATELLEEFMKKQTRDAPRNPRRIKMVFHQNSSIEMQTRISRKKCLKVALLLATGLIGTGVILPAKENGPDARSLFERLKRLEGSWQEVGKTVEGGTTPVVHEFHASAGGSVVLEIMDPDGEREINIYFLEGDDLLMTHYCGGGNQPTLKLILGESSSDALSFIFSTARNLKNPSKDRHIHASELVFLGPNRIESSWVVFKDGKKLTASKFLLERSGGGDKGVSCPLTETFPHPLNLGREDPAESGGLPYLRNRTWGLGRGRR